MEMRVLLAILIFCTGLVVTRYFHAQLGEARKLAAGEDVAQTMAEITEVITPTVKKSQSVADIRTRVSVHFNVKGKTYKGGYSIPYPGNIPAVGDGEPVRYLRSNPKLFVRESEAMSYPAQVKGLEYIVPLLAVASFAVPLLLLVRQS